MRRDEGPVSQLFVATIERFFSILPDEAGDCVSCFCSAMRVVTGPSFSYTLFVTSEFLSRANKFVKISSGSVWILLPTSPKNSVGNCKILFLAKVDIYVRQDCEIAV